MGRDSLKPAEFGGLRSMLTLKMQAWLADFAEIESQFPVVGDDEQDVLERTLLQLVHDFGEDIPATGEKQYVVSLPNLNRMIGKSAELIYDESIQSYIITVKPE